MLCVLSASFIIIVFNFSLFTFIDFFKGWFLDNSLFHYFTEGSQLSRRDSMATKSLSDWNNWSPDNRTEDKISPSTSSINSSIFKVRFI